MYFDNLAPQPPGSAINPAICAGITGLFVGIGIGIGFGALIFNPYRAGRVGGGIWFGKRRRKRSLISDEDYEDFFNEQDNIAIAFTMVAGVVSACPTPPSHPTL